MSGRLPPMIGRALAVGIRQTSAGTRVIRRKRREPDPDPDEHFEWTGVVLPHWVVCGKISRKDKHGNLLYRCTSHCGVSSNFDRNWLARGATRSCEACRPGTSAPPGSRVVPESELPAHRNQWERVNMVIEQRSNLKGDGVSVWNAQGLPVILAVIDATGLTRTFGWKIFVRDCHVRKVDAGSKEVWVRGIHDSVRRLELGVRPKKCKYMFEIDLQTGRTDVDWKDVSRKLQDAVTAYGAPPPAPVEVADDFDAEIPVAAGHLPPPAPVPNGTPAKSDAAVLGGMDLSKLMKLRDGFDHLIAIGRDVASAEEIKRETAVALHAAEAKAGPLKARFDAAAEVATRDAQAVTECEVEIDRLAQQLTQAQDRLAALRVARDASMAARDQAQADYAPARDGLELARKSLAEVERMEAERMKTLARTGDVSVLLAALAKLTAAE